MERYEILTVERPEEIERAPLAPIDVWRWMSNGYTPPSAAALVYLRGEGFLCRLSCCESEPLALCREQDGAVYRDSCLEFFVNFAPEKGEDYLNFELNALGTLHCKRGPGRGGRQPLPPELERPRVRCEIFPDRWQAELFIPLATVRALFGTASFAPGDVLRGNFYKCGDAAPLPHYGMWSPVPTDRPDFHRPEYFGELVIV